MLVLHEFDECPRCTLRHARGSRQQIECTSEIVHGAVRYLVTTYFIDGKWANADIMTAALLLNTQFMNLQARARAL